MDKEFSKGKEKRRYLRIDSSLKVLLKTEDGEEDALYEGVSNNISKGGLCLTVYDNIEELLKKLARKSFPFNVSIELADPDEIVEADAVTKWTHSCVEWVKMPAQEQDVLYIGLGFKKLSDTAQEKISSHIDQKKSQGFVRSD